MIEETTAPIVEAAVDSSAGASSSQAAPAATVSTVTNDGSSQGGKLLYTPITIKGVRMSRCLVDTGAQINLIPRKDIVKNGWTYDKAGAQVVYGFDGQPSALDGVFSSTIQVGPTTKKDVRFHVSPSISVPILGIDTLRDMGFSVNCAEGELVAESTGHIIRCSVVLNQKN